MTNTVTATDINGCQSIVDVFIDEVSPLVATANITAQPTCQGADGAVTIRGPATGHLARQ